MMPPGRNGLQHEALSSEGSSVLAFGDLLRGKAVAVGGEAGGFVAFAGPPSVGVGGGEEAGGEEAGFYFGHLGVEGFGDEEGGAVAEVVEEALWVE